jgi:hypothetical protein
MTWAGVRLPAAARSFCFRQIQRSAPQESNQDVGFDTLLKAVKDGPQVQLTFEGAEDGFHFGELDVLTPEFFWIVIG